MVTLARIIKYGLQSFVRNGLLTVSTVTIMVLALFVFEGMLLFNAAAKTAVASLQEKIDISVYFKTNTSEDTILNIKRSLEGLSEVKSAEYISKEEALARFKEKHQTDEVISQTLEELEENPLLASVNIKAKDPRNYGMIADYLEKSSLGDVIEKVTYAQNKLVIDRLTAIVDAMKKGGVLLTFFLSLAAILVTFNAIRLAIYSNSDQISVMRLVGASNSFIRGPYVMEGIFYGLVAAIFSFLIWLPIIKTLSPYVLRFVSDMNLTQYLNEHFLSLFFYPLLFGVALGVISSVVAIRRYLKT